MSVYVYTTDPMSGRHSLIHQFGPEATGAEQHEGELVVLPMAGDALLAVAEGDWDLALVTDERGLRRIETPRRTSAAS